MDDARETKHGKMNFPQSEATFKTWMSEPKEFNVMMPVMVETNDYSKGSFTEEKMFYFLYFC